jgi:hypothetical protein
MASKVTTKTIGKDFQKRFLQVLEECEDCWVTIGVHDDTGRYPGANAPSVVQVALFMEFGTPGAKHPSPARSFLRSSIQESEALIVKWRDTAIENMVLKKWPVEKGLEQLGYLIRELIRNKIKSNIAPVNAAWTLRNKVARGSAPAKAGIEGSGVGARTLIDTGLLLDSIGYQVWMKGRPSGPPRKGKS